MICTCGWKDMFLKMKISYQKIMNYLGSSFLQVLLYSAGQEIFKIE